MKNISKILVSGLIIVSPMLFASCSDDNNVGRDRGVPNNIEDNYSGDADHNKTGEHEEEVKEGARNIKNGVKTEVVDPIKSKMD